MKPKHLFVVVALSASAAMSPVAGDAEIDVTSGNRILVVQPSESDAAPFDVGRVFAPSGWMGDFKGLRTESGSDAPPGARGSRRWIWMPAKFGAGWVGVAYQYPDRNWGDRPGRDLSGKGYQELSVWARGEPDKSGRLPVIQFKSGGATDPAKKYQASFEAEGNVVELAKEWGRYVVPIAGKDLSRVTSAFTFVLRAEDHPLGADIFLAQIELR